MAILVRFWLGSGLGSGLGLGLGSGSGLGLGLAYQQPQQLEQPATAVALQTPYGGLRRKCRDEVSVRTA